MCTQRNKLESDSFRKGLSHQSEKFNNIRPAARNIFGRKKSREKKRVEKKTKFKVPRIASGSYILVGTTENI